MREEKVKYYDIIGDVHGCAEQLKTLLGEIGYAKSAEGVHRHPERTAVFVGDLVDRGPGQLEVLKLVKAMVDAGSAHIVMGNHEFNAIAWATIDPATGEPVRPHSAGNHRQHEAFLEQLSADERRYYLDWFKTLPLWLDLGDIRVVHACWHEESMKVVREAAGSDRLSTDELIVEAGRKGTELYDAVEVLLKGPEIPLTDHGMVPYWDHKSGKERKQARIRWWDHDASTLPELAELTGAKLQDHSPYPLPTTKIEVSPDFRGFVYTDHVPLFYGHYWRTGEPVHKDDWTTYTACVDFSAISGGTLVAYRWSGEKEIQVSHYVPQNPAIVSPEPADETV